MPIKPDPNKIRTEANTGVGLRTRKDLMVRLRGMPAYHKLTELQKEWIIVNHQAAPWVPREELLDTIKKRNWPHFRDVTWNDIFLVESDPEYINVSIRVAGSMLGAASMRATKNLISIAESGSNKALAIKAIGMMYKALGWTQERNADRAYEKRDIKTEVEHMSDEQLIREAGMDENELKGIAVEEVRRDDPPQAKTGS